MYTCSEYAERSSSVIYGAGATFFLEKLDMRLQPPFFALASFYANSYRQRNKLLNIILRFLRASDLTCLS